MITIIVLVLIVVIVFAAFFVPFSIYKHRLTSDNWFHTAYELFNDDVFAFKNNISKQEQTYIDAVIKDFDFEYEFNNGYEISPYSFSVSIDLNNGGVVNPTRVNVGSVEKDIRQQVNGLLDHIKVPKHCEPGFKYYGIGWDLVDRIIKIYTLKEDRSEIQCYVYKVKRDNLHNVISTTFDTKKTYAVGKKKTIMHKYGMSIEQINASRFVTKDMLNPIANAWVKRMQRLGFKLDTYSRYDGKINLYFD